MNSLPNNNKQRAEIAGNLRWTKEKAIKALEKGKIVKVGGAKSKGTTTLVVTGAPNQFKSDIPAKADLFYIINGEYSIVGLQNDIVAAYTHAGVSAEDIQTLLDRGINRDNYLTEPFKTMWKNEVDRVTGSKPLKAKIDEEQVMDELEMIGQYLKRREYKTFGGKKEVKKGGKKTTKTANMVDKYTLIVEERGQKVLDVSSYDAATGKGSKVLKTRPGHNGGKVGHQGIPLVSNNIESYSAALDKIYPPATLSSNDAAIIREYKDFTRSELAKLKASVGLPANKSSSPKGQTLLPPRAASPVQYGATLGRQIPPFSGVMSPTRRL